MPSAAYSFLDVATLDRVRNRFAVGDALVILSADLENVIWANGPGAFLFGHDDVETLLGAASRLSPTARRQIAATSGFPDLGEDRPLMVRLTSGLRSQAVAFLASALVMPDGEKAILLAVPAAQLSGDGDQRLRRAVGGFSEPGHCLAFLDGAGRVEAASQGFEALGLSEAHLGPLVASFEPGQRLLKRVLTVGTGRLPVGVARLTDDPVRHLLVVVDERPIEAMSSDSEAQDPASQEPAPAATPVTAVPPVATAAPAATAATPAELLAGLSEDAPAVRFVWRTDEEGRFSQISPEFARVVGERAADILGRNFHAVSVTFALDPGDDIANLLQRRDTWSGKTVLWPVEGTNRKVPVDLAALPVYNRDRVFEGFRGFGILRPSEAILDPEGIGMALVPNPKPAEDEIAAAAAVEPAEAPSEPIPASENVVSFTQHRLIEARGLSPVERTAFREIGDRLRKSTEAAGTPVSEHPSVETKSAADNPAREEPSMLLPEADGVVAPEPVREDLLATDDSASVENETVQAEPEAVAPQVEDEQAIEPSASETSMFADEIAPAGEPHESREDAVADPDEEAVLVEQTAQVSDGERNEAEAMRLASDPDAKASPHAAPAKSTPDLAPEADTAGTEAALIERMPFPVLVHSGDRMHYANPEFLSLVGYESIDGIAMAGGWGRLFVPPLDTDVAVSEHRLKMRGADGAEFAVDVLLRSIPWEGGRALMLVIKPARVEPEQAAVSTAAPSMVAMLQGRVAELRAIIDTATDGVALIEKDGTIRSISRPAEALFGRDGDEVVGKPFASLFAIESQRSVRDYLGGLSDNGVASVLNDGREVIGREADGGFIPMFMTIGRLPNDTGYCAVLRDITPWKRAEEELTQARSLAERASSQKTDFLARISHEIRTPLNAIIGFSELMVDEKFGPVGNERYRDYLRDINRSGNHVLDLVNDLLDISKIEAGQQEMDYEAVSINDVLTETVALMQPQANRERVIIRSSFASRLPEVVADVRSLRQIALNLLSNAVRYTQAGGQVIVSTSYEPSGDIAFRVRDTGIGMSHSEIEQALKPFKQLNALKRPRGDGTGLGLPLTKAMVEANRARFSIASTPGEGTLVEVMFPSTRVLAE